MDTDFSSYYEAKEPDRRERAYGWATAIGLQAVDGLKTSAALVETAKRNIEGEISAAEARRPNAWRTLGGPLPRLATSSPMSREAFIETAFHLS